MAKIVSAEEIESPTPDEDFRNQVSTLDSRPSRVVTAKLDQAERLLQELAQKRQSELLNYSLWEKLIGTKKGRLLVQVDCSEVQSGSLEDTVVQLLLRICQQAIDTVEGLPKNRGSLPDYYKRVITAELNAENSSIERKRNILPSVLDFLAEQLHLERITLALTNFDKLPSVNLTSLQPYLLHIFAKEDFGKPNRNVLFFHEKPITHYDLERQIGLLPGEGYTVDQDFTES